MQNGDVYALSSTLTQVNGVPTNFIALRRGGVWQSAFGGTYFGVNSEVENILEATAFGTSFNIVLGQSVSLTSTSVDPNIPVGNMFAFLQGTSPSTALEIIQQSPVTLPTSFVNASFLDGPFGTGSTRTYQLYLALALSDGTGVYRVPITITEGPPVTFSFGASVLIPTSNGAQPNVLFRKGNFLYVGFSSSIGVNRFPLNPPPDGLTPAEIVANQNISNTISAMFDLEPSGNRFLVGGLFSSTSVGTVQVQSVATLDASATNPQQAQPFGSVRNVVRQFFQLGSDLYMIGSLQQVGQDQARNLAIYDPVIENWRSFGGEFDDTLTTQTTIDGNIMFTGSQRNITYQPFATQFFPARTQWINGNFVVNNRSASRIGLQYINQVVRLVFDGTRWQVTSQQPVLAV